MHQITIHIGHKADGFVFRLDPRSEAWIKTLTGRLQSLPSVSIGFDERSSIENISNEIFEQVAEMLTGIDGEKLAAMGIHFVDARTERTVHTI